MRQYDRLRWKNCAASILVHGPVSVVTEIATERETVVAAVRRLDCFGYYSLLRIALAIRGSLEAGRDRAASTAPR